jgi:serine/threonine protein kinase
LNALLRCTTGDDISTMFGVFDAYPMTLQRMRAAGPPVLPAPQLLTMGLQVLDGLLFLQANRIAHCDVKTDNVLVDDCGCCYIADLGEANELVRFCPSSSSGRCLTLRASKLSVWLCLLCGDTADRY